MKKRKLQVISNRQSRIRIIGILYITVSIALVISGCNNSLKYNRIPSKPNLFIFLADDLSKQDLGYTGNHFVSTPAIDDFAENSIEFTKMYTPTAMCAPSRSSLYTGLYPHANGCHMNHGSTYKHINSIPTYLKELGYEVALVNKGHIKPRSVYPFDYLTIDELEDYLFKSTSPVCIIYASDEPHGPHPKEDLEPDSVIIPPKWLDTKSTRESLAGYYKDIATLDREFADFIKVLKSNKLDKNSILIFTSDHGNGYYAKWSCYEAGLQVPFFIQTKGFGFKAEKINALSSFVDIVPTFIELAGGKVQENLDGKSLLPLLCGKKELLHNYIYGSHTNRGIYSGKAYPIRSISDGKFKYIRNLNSEKEFQNILTNGRNFGDTSEASREWKEWLIYKDSIPWVSFYQKRPAEELYNLDEDPDELYNLANQLKYSDIKSALSDSLKTWMIRQNDQGMKSEILVPLKE